MNTVETSYRPTPTRTARDGETCSCGRPAIEVYLCDDLGPVPYCGTAGDGHKPSDCPPWCVQEHEFPFDRGHMSQSRQVRLDADPRQHLVLGQWETDFRSLLIGLTKGPGAKPTYIEVVEFNEDYAIPLTAYEAEQLSRILQEFATILRRQETT
jgi:hypothetical protein